MEEWEYVEGHKDLYKEVMMEDQLPLTLPDGSRRRNPVERFPRPLYSQDCPEGYHKIKVEDEEKERMRGDPRCMSEVKEEEMPGDATPDGSRRRNPAERCPRPLYSQDCPEGNHRIKEEDEEKERMRSNPWCTSEVKEEEMPGDATPDGSRRRNPAERCPRPLYSQDCPEGNHKIKVEEEEDESLWGHHPCMTKVKKEETPGDATPENPSNATDGNFMLSLKFEVEDEEVFQLPSRETRRAINVYPGRRTISLSYNPPKQEEPSPDPSPVVTTRTDLSYNPPNLRKPSDPSPVGTTRTDLSYNSPNLRKPSHPSQRINTSIDLLYNPPYDEEPSPDQSPVVNTRDDLSYNPPNLRKPSDISLVVTTRTDQKDGKKFHCVECGKEFTRRSDLLLHRSRHNKKYSCSLCGKCFTDDSELVSHERLHTAEYPYSCSRCVERFAQKSDLVKHQESHSKFMKPSYLCPKCGKSFTSKSNLRSHEAMHEKQENGNLYPCSECERIFTLKCHLVSHVKVHKGQLYPCSECNASFSSESSLILHKRCHTGGK
ncbi:uncharacterized protein [Dendropsophus ebraccatus]|uniref:uncharacterized protein n=1 Tax=Dendropsophus ebraccatus TaxID=150705 RepID=UPI003831BF34